MLVLSIESLLEKKLWGKFSGHGRIDPFQSASEEIFFKKMLDSTPPSFLKWRVWSRVSS